MSRWYDSISQQWVETDFEFGKRKKEPEPAFTCGELSGFTINARGAAMVTWDPECVALWDAKKRYTAGSFRDADIIGAPDYSAVVQGAIVAPDVKPWEPDPDFANRPYNVDPVFYTSNVTENSYTLTFTGTTLPALRWNPVLIPDGFTPWNGDGCPQLMLADQVEVLFRDGELDVGAAHEFAFDWSDGETWGGDVIAYRVIP